MVDIILTRNGKILVRMKAKAKNVWQVQEAKAKLSAVIEKAAKSGPQVITKHGAECAAVISIEDLKALRTRETNARFVDHLLNAPKFSDEEIEIMFKRDPDPGRMIDFSGPEFARDDEK
jgi:antitoxin Phd